MSAAQVISYLFDAFIVFAGVRSAWFWHLSSKVAPPGGFDNDEEDQKAWRKLGSLNQKAAVWAAVSMVLLVFKDVVQLLGQVT